MDLRFMKTRPFSLETQLTGITRKQAAEAMQAVLKGKIVAKGITREQFNVWDENSRFWSIKYDETIKPTAASEETDDQNYSIRIVSPMMTFKDIPVIQEVMSVLAEAGANTGLNGMNGNFINLKADDFSPQQLRNLVNIYSSKEDLIWNALRVSPQREQLCRRLDKDFIEALNSNKNAAIEDIKAMWYKGVDARFSFERDKTANRALNLHNLFTNGMYSIQCCNATLDPQELKAQLVLALAINNMAMVKKRCSPAVTQCDNMRYSFRIFLINMGLNGSEFQQSRSYLLKNLEGNSAWKNPEDAVAQRERIKQENQQNENETDEEISDDIEITM